MKKRNLEKLVEKTKETINMLIDSLNYHQTTSDFDEGLKAGQEIAFKNLLKYIEDEEQELKWREKVGLDEIF